MSRNKLLKTRRLTCSVTLVAGLVAALGAVKVAAQDWDHDHDDQSRVKKGFAIAPVPLDMKGKDRDLVGLGSYLVNAVGGCNDCHTNPSFAAGGNPYLHQPKVINAAHYLAGGQLFGPFISRNLTPENGLPAGRTYDEFLKILRTGIDLDHAHPLISDLLQVMPWPTYQNLNDHDIRAIYEYLRAIPPATPGP